MFDFWEKRQRRKIRRFVYASGLWTCNARQWFFGDPFTSEELNWRISERNLQLLTRKFIKSEENCSIFFEEISESKKKRSCRKMVERIVEEEKTSEANYGRFSVHANELSERLFAKMSTSEPTKWEFLNTSIGAQKIHSFSPSLTPWIGSDLKAQKKDSSCVATRWKSNFRLRWSRLSARTPVLVDISDDVFGVPCFVCFSYIRDWKITSTAHRKPNNNKNHTNDGTKAEYGWNYRVRT